MTIDYHLMRPQEAESTSRMILRSFNKFNASELTSDGVALMLEYVTPAALKHRQHQNHLIFVAVEDDKVIGMAEIRDYGLLSLLYVDPDRLQEGVATELWSHVKLMCKQAKPGLSEIRVESSSYAVPIYVRLGFAPGGEKTVKNGIPIQPMVYHFSDDEMQHVRAEFTQALDASPDDILKAILFEFRNALSPVVSGATLLNDMPVPESKDLDAVSTYVDSLKDVNSIILDYSLRLQTMLDALQAYREAQFGGEQITD